MNDREKVIKGLAHCTRPTEYGKGGNRCMDCPYTEAIGFNQFKCNGQQMMNDALAMLKEQEAVEPKYKGSMDGFFTGLCPTCGTALNSDLNAKACGKCGQAVKWE